MKILICTVLSLLVFTANASVIYDFEGICSDGCSGIATGVLTLADSYTPGTQVADADFISFTYTSSSGSFAIPTDLALNRFNKGILPVSSGSSIEWVEIDAIQSGTSLHGCGVAGIPDTYFCPSAGFWSAEWAPFGITRDIGLSHTWTLVPVPPAVWLFGSGLLGLIGLAKRKA